MPGSGHPLFRVRAFLDPVIAPRLVTRGDRGRKRAEGEHQEQRRRQRGFQIASSCRIKHEILPAPQVLIRSFKIIYVAVSDLRVSELLLCHKLKTPPQ
jgi:hypothetical protein